MLVERTDSEVDAPILWSPDANSWLIGKNPDAGKDWRQKVERKTEDEMVGWHHQFNEHELGQTPGHVEGQGRLACCRPWNHAEWGRTWQLNNNNKYGYFFLSLVFFLIFKFYILLIELDLHCCTWTFSSCREQGLTSSSSAQASHWNGFYFCGAQGLEVSASVFAVCRVGS